MRVEGRSERADELAAVAELWPASYGSKNTRSAYAGDLSAFNHWCGEADGLPVEATTADIARYLEWSRAEGVSPATVSRRRSALTSFVDFAGRHETSSGD